MTTAPSPAPTAAVPTGTGTAAEAPAGPGLLAQVGPWLGYAGCFVGAGLVSGAIVHRPLDPGRYTVLAAAGMLAFLVATLLPLLLGDGPRPGRGALLRVAGGSLLLALGIGMLSGGIQHFADVPDRAVVLVPAGLLLSWLAFQLRAGSGLKGLVLSRATGGVAVLALGLVVGLPHVAPSTSAAEHGHAPVLAAEAVAADEGAAAAPAHDEATHAPEAALPGAPAPAADGAGTAAPDLDDALAELEARMADLAAEQRR